jgi:hypothetical protein
MKYSLRSMELAIVAIVLVSAMVALGAVYLYFVLSLRGEFFQMD